MIASKEKRTAVLSKHVWNKPGIPGLFWLIFPKTF
jgi:hypothetical protein